MKSPITGKKMKLKKKIVQQMGLVYEFQYYLCVDSGKQFTITEIDEKNYEVYNKEKRTS